MIRVQVTRLYDTPKLVDVAIVVNAAVTLTGVLDANHVKITMAKDELEYLAEQLNLYLTEHR